MKILWITNSLFEEYFQAKGKHASYTGGWMRSLALRLTEQYPELEIAVAARYAGVDKLEELITDKFTFYALPGATARTKYDSSIEPIWKVVKNRFKPDMVHIHGSEYPHGLAYIRANGTEGVMVSLQGIVSRIARHNSGGIFLTEFLQNLTLYDLLISSTPFKETRNYRHLGKMEEELLSRVNHIIGRTSWDKVHSWAINPTATYHFCNETLRSEFYSTNKWDLSKCQPHRIFLSQAAKPIKGIHKVIEALPYILRKYPDTEIYVAGNNFTRHDDLHSKLRYMTYGKYVNKLMKKYGISDKIHFLGMLNAEQMAEQYRMANVFICPSSIENSPNSLGEAQLMGCPVVASYVGGVPDMVENGINGLLYRFEEHEMLAYNVCRVFSDGELANTLSVGGVKAAIQRHDGERNAEKMMEIYRQIYSE
ncbi:MAG: glycosyltransferase family 4 protein [Muribaculum sp.]|nr:glycosyltransferase family 4 protein [Muribaculum sp.]